MPDKMQPRCSTGIAELRLLLAGGLLPKLPELHTAQRNLEHMHMEIHMPACIPGIHQFLLHNLCVLPEEGVMFFFQSVHAALPALDGVEVHIRPVLVLHQPSSLSLGEL